MLLAGCVTGSVQSIAVCVPFRALLGDLEHPVKARGLDIQERNEKGGPEDRARFVPGVTERMVPWMAWAGES